MKKIILILILKMLILTSFYAQTNLPICKGIPNSSQLNFLASTLCVPSSTTYAKYINPNTYIPNNNTALITLNITLHVFTYTNGTASPGLFGSDPGEIGNPSVLLSRISSITNDAGERYSSQRVANYEPNFNLNQITDSKIRYVVSNIYYYPNEALYTNTATTAYQHLDYINSNFPERLNEGLPIILSHHGPDFGHAYVYSNGLPYVAATVTYYDPPHFKNHLLHEIGHTFGLMHTYPISCCPETMDCNNIDYLNDVFPPNNLNCNPFPTGNTCNSCYEIPGNPSTLGSNNFMGASSVYPGTWWSPKQMARRNRAMRLNPVRTFAKDLPSDHINKWNITASETWDFDIQMYEDIVVKSGNTLKVTCKINMAREGRIIVEKGAQLIVDGGEITTWSKTGRWDGIYLEGTSNATQFLPDQSRIEIKNNA
ncbi:MAG: hypothetical protein IM600_15475, partial [Bacteroidetes bacterium]|nr:hypothetical protein [Bacteroidota bacterium]